MADHHIGPPDDIAEIERIREAVVQAENDGDARALGQLFADDIAMLPTGNQVHGSGAVEEFHRQLYERLDFDADFTIERILVLGDLAVENGSYFVNTTSKEDGSQERVEGHYLYSYQRDEAGEWKIHGMSWLSK